MASFITKVKRRVRSIILSTGPNTILDTGTGNQLTIAQGAAKRCRIVLQGNDNQVTIAKGASVSNLLIFVQSSRNRLHIGENVIYCKGEVWFTSDDGVISIGDRTYIADAFLTVTEPKMSVEIGSDCLISWAVDIRCGDGHPIIDKTSGAKLNYARPIKISDHVWIAAHVQVLKGVTIGNDSIIGAHSLLTRDIPANCVAAGSPARVLRENVTWLKENLPVISGVPGASGPGGAAGTE